LRVCTVTTTKRNQTGTQLLRRPIAYDVMFYRTATLPITSNIFEVINLLETRLRPASGQIQHRPIHHLQNWT